MKANERRKVFDAVDLLTEDTAVSVPATKVKNGVTMLSIDSIKPFHDHPFHLYKRARRVLIRCSRMQRHVQIRMKDTLFMTGMAMWCMHHQNHLNRTRKRFLTVCVSA